MTALIEQIGLSGRTNSITAARLATLNRKIELVAQTVRMLDDLIERYSLPAVRSALTNCQTLERDALEVLKNQREAVLAPLSQTIHDTTLDRVIDATEANDPPFEQDTMNFTGSTCDWTPSGSLDQELASPEPVERAEPKSQAVTIGDYGSLNWDALENEARGL